jgi:hypothetical protein
MLVGKSSLWVATLVLVALLAPHAYAQDLVLRDTTLTTAETFLARAITLGPDVTVSGSGDVVVRAESIAVVPKFFVVSGARIQMIVGGNPVGVAIEEKELPQHFKLSQNYPNPFNLVTAIYFSLPLPADVTLTVFDALGRQVRELASGTKPAGTHEVSFDAGGLPSGTYLYRFEAGDFVVTKRMVVVR